MRLLSNTDELFENLEHTLKTLPENVQNIFEQDSAGARRLLVAAAWVMGGLGVVTLGLMAGRELRGRYKFKRRTPYDYYAHSGDRSAGLDYSVGI